MFVRTGTGVICIPLIPPCGVMRKMKTRQCLLKMLLMASGAAATVHATTVDTEISGFAFVQEDSSLKIAGTLVRLYGIYVPPTDQSCYTFIRPIPCGPRAALALDFKISGDFVHCVPRYVRPDGSVIASCRSGNEDLSEWMLQRGWAVALPDAPFEYTAMEKIARARGIGVWGIPIEVIPRRREHHK